MFTQPYNITTGPTQVPGHVQCTRSHPPLSHVTPIHCNYFNGNWPHHYNNVGYKLCPEYLDIPNQSALDPIYIYFAKIFYLDAVRMQHYKIRIVFGAKLTKF